MPPLTNSAANVTIIPQAELSQSAPIKQSANSVELEALSKTAPNSDDYKLIGAALTLNVAPGLTNRLNGGTDQISKQKIVLELANSDLTKNAKDRTALPFKSELTPEQSKALKTVLDQFDKRQITMLPQQLVDDAPMIAQSLVETANTIILPPPTAKANLKNDGNKETKSRSVTNLMAQALVGSYVSPVSTASSVNNPGPTIRGQTEQTIDPKLIASTALKLFDQLDVNKDGVLSVRELSKAVQDPKYSGQDAQTIAALYQIAKSDLVVVGANSREEKGLSKHEIGLMGKRIARTLEEIDQSVTALGYLNKNFLSIDSNKDGFLSTDELRRKLWARKADGTSELSLTDKENISWAIQNQKRLQQHFDDGRLEGTGISNNDIARTVYLMPRGGANGLYPISITERTQESQQQGVCLDLYLHPENPKQDVNPEAVGQGLIGDCYFLASLASVASSNPELIVKMITDNGNGTYTVTFPGDPKHPVTVDAPTEAEMGLFNKGGKEGTWACVLEKAYGRYRQEVGDQSTSRPPQTGADGGGHPTDSLKLLTGDYFKYMSVTEDPNKDIRKKLVDSFSNGNNEPIVAVISRGGFGGSKETPDGFATRHAYTITNFDPSGPDGGTVYIRNPWGQASGTGGNIAISYKQFCENFTHICAEDTK